MDGEVTSQADVALYGRLIPLHGLVDGAATSSQAEVGLCGHHIRLHSTVGGEASSKGAGSFMWTSYAFI